MVKKSSPLPNDPFSVEHGGVKKEVRLGWISFFKETVIQE